MDRARFILTVMLLVQTACLGHDEAFTPAAEPSDPAVDAADIASDKAEAQPQCSSVAQFCSAIDTPVCEPFGHLEAQRVEVPVMPTAIASSEGRKLADAFRVPGAGSHAMFGLGVLASTLSLWGGKSLSPTYRDQWVGHLRSWRAREGTLVSLEQWRNLIASIHVLLDYAKEWNRYYTLRFDGENAAIARDVVEACHLILLAESTPDSTPENSP